MAELIALSELILRVQTEASLSQNAAHIINMRPTIIGLLNRAQRDLAANTDWDELETHQIVPTVAGDFTYDIPNVLNYEKIREVWHRSADGDLTEMKLGFGPEQFAILSPTDDERSTPVTRWRLSTTSVSSFDVWPLPSIAGNIDFVGQKVLTRLVDDADICQLDADVLSLRTAAALLAKNSPADARLKLDDAQRRIVSLRSDQSSSKGDAIVYGGGLRRQFVNAGR